MKFAIKHLQQEVFIQQKKQEELRRLGRVGSELEAKLKMESYERAIKVLMEVKSESS